MGIQKTVFSRIFTVEHELWQHYEHDYVPLQSRELFVVSERLIVCIARIPLFSRREREFPASLAALVGCRSSTALVQHTHN